MYQSRWWREESEESEKFRERIRAGYPVTSATLVRRVAGSRGYPGRRMALSVKAFSCWSKVILPRDNISIHVQAHRWPIPAEPTITGDNVAKRGVARERDVAWPTSSRRSNDTPCVPFCAFLPRIAEKPISQISLRSLVSFWDSHLVSRRWEEKRIKNRAPWQVHVAYTRLDVFGKQNPTSAESYFQIYQSREPQNCPTIEQVYL